MWSLNTPRIRQTIVDLASGTTRRRVSRRNLGLVELPSPPIQEQKRIVEILEEQFSRLDAALASIHTARDKAAQFRRSLLQAAFSGELTGTESASTWHSLPLDALVANKADITDGPFGSNLKTAHYSDHGPRVIRLQNIGSGWFKDEEAHISYEHFERLRKHEVIAGDVLVATLGEELPRACMSPDSLGPAIVKADCIRVRPGTKLDGHYLMYLLNSPMIRGYFSTEIKGIVRPRLNLSDIRRLPVPVPDLAVQQQIVAVLEEEFSRLDDALNVADHLEARIAAERRSLLHAALSGALTSTWRETLNV